MLYCCTIDLIERQLTPAEKVKYPFVRKKLLELMEADQADRKHKSILDQNATEASWLKLVESDLARAKEVLILLKEIRLPSTRNIGLDGSRAIWLIALHNVEYMQMGKTVLTKMKYLYYRDKSQVFYQGIPYLVDRLMIQKNGWQETAKQLYGTQGYIDKKGVKHAFPIVDRAYLKDRRKKFGLGSSKECKHGNG